MWKQLIEAINTNNIAEAKSLVQQIDEGELNKTDDYGKTALHLAAEKGHAPIVELLLSKDGVDVNAQDQYKYTALHKAASKGHKEIVTILLEHKAEVDSFHPCSSPLELAVLRNQPEVIRILLSYGANPNALDPSGLSALHFAAEGGDIEILKLLLDQGGEADKLSKTGNSLVHSAAIGYREGNGKCLDLIKWLLENYEDLVNPFLKNDSGKEPRDILEMKDWSYAEQLDNLLEELGYYIPEEVA
jgi:ankyrin repeat protein